MHFIAIISLNSLVAWTDFCNFSVVILQLSTGGEKYWLICYANNKYMGKKKIKEMSQYHQSSCDLQRPWVPIALCRHYWLALPDVTLPHGTVQFWLQQLGCLLWKLQLARCSSSSRVMKLCFWLPLGLKLQSRVVLLSSLLSPNLTAKRRKEWEKGKRPWEFSSVLREQQEEACTLEVDTS